MGSSSEECERIISGLYERTLRETQGAYNPHVFNGMILKHGGVRAAKLLLQSEDPQYGLVKLWELRRLDLSVEFHVLQSKCSDLFSPDELAEARRRLNAYGFDVGPDGKLVPLTK